MRCQGVKDPFVESFDDEHDVPVTDDEEIFEEEGGDEE